MPELARKDLAAARPLRAGRLTKIVATLGPASSSGAVIEDLVRAGVDVFRLNFSHGSRDEHAARVAAIRDACRRVGRTVGILQDLGGPKIRTGRLAGGGPVPLAPGDVLVLAAGDFEGGPGRVPLAWPPLASCVHPGDRLLLDDGAIELRVDRADGREIATTVIAGGLLGERKGINAPGVALPTDGVTAKDLEDLRFGVEAGVDFVALSFVRSAEDLRRARSAAQAAGGDAVRLVAKIERPEALEHLDEILDSCDGVMVARGDLGLEIPLEKVPGAQKRITREAVARGLPVVIATQVLDSMQRSTRPTRAEVSDAANAVEDLVDAIMLSGETAVGAHPARVVEVLDAVIRDAESLLPPMPDRRIPRPPGAPHAHALCEAAITLARESGANAVACASRSGTTPRALSALRPGFPLFAALPDERTARGLCLHRGVLPMVVATQDEGRPSVRALERALLDAGTLDAGSTVVFAAIDAELGDPDANFLRIGRALAADAPASSRTQ